MTYKVTTVRLPEETIESLDELTDKLEKERSEVMREALQIGIDEMKLRHTIKLYEEGKVSFGRMGELTGLSQRKLHTIMKQRNITYRYGEERFRDETENLVE